MTAAKKKLVFDIEFVSESFDDLDPISQHELTKNLPDKKVDPKAHELAFKNKVRDMVFSPLTGYIIAIGVYDPDTQKGAVYYDAKDTKPEDTEKNGIKYVAMTEAEMLTKFWALAEVHDEFISFFGRRSDVPYLMIRSAIHGVRPTRDLISNRYGNIGLPTGLHNDLADLLSFNGVAMYRGSLHMWCRAFGVETPKTADMGGDKVGQAYQDGKYLEIAEYNAADLISTARLYDHWSRYFKPQV
ncbi:hypothetical protein KBC99_01920 [Candidatus Saccharibacteria bacterium]|nr:hypothetical protein [Candidatus Saccharibacteria bacterium]